MPRDKTGHFYYAWFPTIYEQDTQHLSLAEDGAYRRLIDHYMTTRSPLPSSDKALARIVGCGNDEWQIISGNVLSFFKAKEGNFYHDFCEETIAGDTARILQAQLNGRKGGRPSTSKETEITQPLPDGNPVGSPNPYQPTQNNQNNSEQKNHLVGGVGGFLHSSGLVNGTRFVPSLETCQRLRDITPGWDQNFLLQAYQSWKEKNAIPTAEHPDAAFLGWAKSFTKNKRPR